MKAHVRLALRAASPKLSVAEARHGVRTRTVDAAAVESTNGPFHGMAADLEPR